MVFVYCARQAHASIFQEKCHSFNSSNEQFRGNLSEIEQFLSLKFSLTISLSFFLIISRFLQTANVMEPQLKTVCRWISAISIFNSTFQFFNIIFLVARIVFFFLFLLKHIFFLLLIQHIHIRFLLGKTLSLTEMNSLLFCVIFMTFMTICQIMLRKAILFVASHHIENISTKEI